MSDQSKQRPRIYADFNSCMADEHGRWCWLLRYNGTLLDEVEPSSLPLYDGMPVTLYYEDPAEEFEIDAVLGHVDAPGWDKMWMALIDYDTLRRLRGS